MELLERPRTERLRATWRVSRWLQPRRGRFLETLDLFSRGHQRIAGGWRVSAPELRERLRAGHGETLVWLGRYSEAQPMLEAVVKRLLDQ